MSVEVLVMGFRAWLRGLLEEGMYRSQYEMAESFGVRQPTINHWLHGARQPELESCALISEATGKPMAEIWEMVRADTGEPATAN